MNFTQSLKTTKDAVKPCNFYNYTMYDGYDWMTLQSKHGYWSNPKYGDWPYVCFANGRNAENSTYIIKEFCEHDVKTWIYSNDDEGREEYAHHLEQLNQEYKGN